MRRRPSCTEMMSRFGAVTVYGEEPHADDEKTVAAFRLLNITAIIRRLLSNFVRELKSPALSEVSDPGFWGGRTRTTTAKAKIRHANKAGTGWASIKR